MHLSPSVQSYVDDPGHYHLQMQGDTLHAVEGKVEAIGHEILFPQLQELKGLTDEPLAQNVLTAIRNEQLGVGNSASLFSRIWTTVASLFGGGSLPDFETNLHEWCEEKIGTPEYANRIEAAKRIQECYLKKEPILNLNDLGLTTLPNSIGNLTALQHLDCSDNKFTAIPLSLARLSKSCSGSFENNRFTRANIQLFREAVTAERAINPDHGPVFHFPIHASNPLQKEVSAERRGSLTGLETNLHEWCEEKIGTPEYANRIKAAKRIQECYLEKKDALVLNGLGLTTLPDSIGNLKTLQHLDCQGNRLTTLPDPIGNLTALQTLNCRGNQLITLPNSIGNLTALQQLYCHGNQLTTLPDSIGNLTALQRLNCIRNQLTTLPNSIGNLTALQQLHCIDNHLTTLPDSMGNLTALQILYCTNNHLTTFPDSIGNLMALQTLHCENNQLTTLPDSIGNLTTLQTLHCENNQLTTLPDSIGNLTALQTLHCRGNQLTAIPLSLARLPNSCSGYFGNNRLTPASIQLFREAITAERAINPAHGAVFDFAIYDSNPLQEGVSPEESLIFWLKAFQKAFPRAAHETMWISRRERFPPEEVAAGASSFLNFYAPLLSHPEKDNLRTFLVKLQGADAYKNPRTQNNMIFRLEQILTSACEDPDFRVQFFLMIRDAVDTCGDRAAWGFDQLDTYCRLHCEAKNLDDLSVAKLLIGKARVERLKQIAAQDVEERRANPSTTTGINEIDVFLYYQVKLKAALHLPISSEGMLYPAMSDVTEAKLLAASKKVKDETSKPEQIAALLAASEERVSGSTETTLWEDRLQKAYPARFDAINEKIMERVASMPEELSEAERQSQMKNLQEEQKARTRQLIRDLSLKWVSEHWNELGL